MATAMNAWLVTWEWVTHHAKVSDPLIAILSARKGDRWIASYIEGYYLMTSCTAQEVAYLVNRPHTIPYKASRHFFIINGVPHGDRMRCGNNPFIYARKVTNLTVTEDREHRREIIRWKEPPIFRWKDELRNAVEIAQEGTTKTLERPLETLIRVNGIAG